MVRYEDGHATCYAGHGLIVPSTAIQQLEGLSRKMNEDFTEEMEKRMEQQSLWFPRDAEKTIDAKALNWLAKYGIMRSEIVEHEIQWSRNFGWLLFPFKDANGKLLAWQARTDLVNPTERGVGANPNKSKWWSRGPIHDVMNLIGDHDGPVVLVEDIVSAIKVGRYACSMPIFGSSVTVKQRIRMRGITKEVIIWLDPDKYKEANTMASAFALQGITTKVVYSDADPKACTDKLIQDAVREMHP